MKATVKDCLQLDSFRKAIAVAGENKLDNRVKAISVLDANSIDEVKKSNSVAESMVFTTFSGMREDTELQCNVIKELANKGVSAIVFFQRDRKLKQLEKIVTKTADEVNIPFIIMVDSEEMDYSTVITDVMENLLCGNNFKNSLINNTIFHLLNFEKHSSFQQALHEAAVNNGFQVILLSKDLNPIFTVETRHKTTIEEAIRRRKETSMDSSNVYSLVEVNGVLTYWGLIQIKNSAYYIFIVDNDDNYSATEITKLAEIIELAMGMWKFTPERDAKAEFVRALIRGNKSLAYSLNEEAGIKASDIISVLYAKNIDVDYTDSLLAKYTKEKLLNVIKVSEQDETYAIILKGQATKDHEDNYEKIVCNNFFSALKTNKQVRIFHVAGINGIEGAADGFRLIAETWSFVESIFPYKRVFSKYELALVSNCVNIQMQGGYLQKNYMDLLEPFRREADNKSRQLLETLETFVLDAGMNSAKTAEFMGVHTNTVQYRLKKINDMLGAEMTGNRIIPGLTMALALQRMEGK